MTWFLPPTYQTRKLHSSYPSHAPTPSNLLKLADCDIKTGCLFLCISSNKYIVSRFSDPVRALLYQSALVRTGKHPAGSQEGNIGVPPQHLSTVCRYKEPPFLECK